MHSSQMCNWRAFYSRFLCLLLLSSKSDSTPYGIRPSIYCLLFCILCCKSLPYFDFHGVEAFVLSKNSKFPSKKLAQFQNASVNKNETQNLTPAVTSSVGRTFVTSRNPKNRSVFKVMISFDCFHNEWWPSLVPPNESDPKRIFSYKIFSFIENFQLCGFKFKYSAHIFSVF